MFETVIDQFIEFGRSQRGLAEVTLSNHRRIATWFLEWVGTRIGHDLRRLTADDLTAYFQEGPCAGWSRASIAGQVAGLRVMLRWMRDRGLCQAKLADCIRAPRLYTHERYPVGPSWSQVQQLVGSARGATARDLRDRAILLLLAIYGFRSAEVRGLRLGDIDWDRETINPPRPKQRKVGTYPLTREVGAAIIAYLCHARPASQHRHVFLTLRRPYRPLSGGGLGTMVRVRQKRLNQKLKRHGPHGLRHACATYLLAEGFTLKEIGDHLGHSMIRATEAYAKVDLLSLRQVGELGIAELVAYEAACAARETPFYAVGDLDALRVVAELSLQGLS